MSTDEACLPGSAIESTSPLALPVVPLPAPATVAAPPAPRSVPVVELAAAVGLVGLADLCLYWGVGGMGQAVLLVAAPLVLLAAAPARRSSARLWWMGALVLTLAARSLWQGGSFTLLLGLSGVFALGVALRTRRSFMPEVFVSSIVSAGGAFTRLWDYFVVTGRFATRGRIRTVRWVRIVVPTLVVGVFAFVFTAANPLIERWVDLAWQSFSVGSFFSVGRVAFWSFAALVAAGLLSPRVRELALSERLGPGHVIEGEIAAPEEDATATARNVLAGVNLLFFAYNALDAVYLWAGTPPPGLDHTTYAHRGTAWLTVSLLLATIVLGVMFRRGMNARTPQTRLVRTLALAWAAQNFVLAAGTFRRIAMYVDDSGLTTLRCFGILGVVVVAIAFALIVLKVARRHTALWLLRRQLDAFLVALVVWTVAPVDAIVWSFNVDRIERGEDKPLLHLFEQGISAEAVPALTRLLDHRDPLVAAGVAERLRIVGTSLALEQGKARRWTQRELSRTHALRSLSDASVHFARLLPAVDANSPYTALRERAFRANGMDPNASNEWEF